MTLAAQITDVIAQLGALRTVAAEGYDGPAQRFLCEAIDGAVANLSQAVMTATDGNPPSCIVRAMLAAERDGDSETALRLLERLRDERECIVASDFTVIPAAKIH